VLDPSRIVVLMIAMSVIALLATVIPAVKVGRLSPLAALRGMWRPAKPLGRPAGDAPGNGRWPLLRLALRNLLRAPLRNALGLSAVVFGLGAFVLVSAIANGFLSQMVENTTGLVTADLQVQHPQFRYDMKPELAFEASTQWLSRIRSLPQVEAASVRVQGTATVGSARKAEPVLLVGIDPAQEVHVSTIQGAVRVGHGLRGARDALIGKKLAERLDARVGEKIVAMAQDASGNLASDVFVVAGILDSGAHGPDTGMAYVQLASAQRLFGTGSRVTNVAVRLHDRSTLDAAIESVRGTLPPGTERDVIGWDRLVPEVAQTANLLKHGVLLILVVVFTMVLMVVVNTMLMSVFERSKEFGTLMAIGAGTRTVVRMVASEAGLLATAGALVGMVVGSALALHFAEVGLTMKAHGSDSLGASNIVHPVLSMPLVFAAAMALWLMVVAASIYPARKIAGLNPVLALRGT
jgi:ABC-type lipoprotein release transport system permease subunit